MAIVVDETTFYTILFMLILTGFVVNRNGGLRIVMWRIRGVKGFIRTEITPEGDAYRTTHKMKIVQMGLQPYYRLKGRDGVVRTWFTGGPNETARAFSFPNWVYDSKDSRPLPLKQVKTIEKEFEQKITTKNDKGEEKVETVRKTVPVVVAGAPIDPLLIDSAFNNKVVEEFNGLDKAPTSKFKWGLMGLAIGIIVIGVFISIYYTYYFGINTACAVHAHGVNCG